MKKLFTKIFLDYFPKFGFIRTQFILTIHILKIELQWINSIWVDEFWIETFRLTFFFSLTKWKTQNGINHKNILLLRWWNHVEFIYIQCENDRLQTSSFPLIKCIRLPIKRIRSNEIPFCDTHQISDVKSNENVFSW